MSYFSAHFSRLEEIAWVFGGDEQFTEFYWRLYITYLAGITCILYRNITKLIHTWRANKSQLHEKNRWFYWYFDDSMY